jgi:hypothetical protein
MGLDILFKKPPAPEWLSLPSSCRWSLWVTLTLWSATDSQFPPYTLSLSFFSVDVPEMPRFVIALFSFLPLSPLQRIPNSHSPPMARDSHL